MKKICKTCRKEFAKKYNYSKRYWETALYCSRQCQWAALRGRDTGRAHYMTCLMCGRSKKASPAHHRKLCSRKCQFAYQKFNHHGGMFQPGHDGMVGPANPLWKGNEVGYVSLHQWVAYHYGKSRICEHCGRKDKKRYEWANVSGEYQRDRSDWIRLCTKCHHAFDHISEKVWAARRAS